MRAARAGYSWGSGWLGIDPKEIKQLNDNINRWYDKVKDKVTNQVEKSCIKVENDAQSAMPSSVLKIYHRLRENKKYGIHGLVTAPRYARYIEWGTGPLSANPYSTKVYKKHPNVRRLVKWLTKARSQMAAYGLMRQTRISDLKGKAAKRQAYAIAKAIEKRGTKPRPFLIPAQEAEMPKFFAAIEDILRRS